MNRKADRSNNAGMTLIELLVAVTMLSIIVVPLLHSFATSAKVGLKSRRNLRITTAAQDIMEGLKAESVETLSCSFNYPGADLGNFHLISSGLVRGKGADLFELQADAVDKTSSSDRSVSVSKNITASADASTQMAGSEYEFQGKDDKKYFFAIRNMQIENDTGDPNFEVDVVIELNGMDYTSEGDEKTRKRSIDPSEEKVLLNDHGRISYGTLNEKRDAFFIQDEALGRQTAQEFNVKYAPETECTEKDLAKQIVITTTLHSEKAADKTSDWISVACQLVYTAPGHLLNPDIHPEYDKDLGGDQPYRMTYDYTIFDNKATGYKPDNIFICFYPGYGVPERDEIIYVNEDRVPSTLHLIKQEKKDNGTLNHDELNYKCKVVINEGSGAAPDHAGTGMRGDSVTPLRTNLDSNLYQVYMPSAPDCKNQTDYYYNGGVLHRNFLKPEENDIYALGGEIHSSDSMYDVTIDICEKGTLDGVLSGGTISKKDILFTLKGSMN